MTANTALSSTLAYDFGSTDTSISYSTPEDVLCVAIQDIHDDRASLVLILARWHLYGGCAARLPVRERIAVVVISHDE